MDTIKLNEPASRLLEDALNSGDDKMMNEPGMAGNTGPEPGGVRAELLKDQIIEALCTIYDPEIPINIYELGLIYDLRVDAGGGVDIKMTLTSPACPVAESLPVEVENVVAAVPGVQNVRLELVWDPPFGIEMMSEAARLQLGLM
ncbi:MAG TPA: iron-sulfur cluster assembly protein [Abditibacteriaceae bacterium]|nr:iron-sulfur cluster assembly protein [Abditibacteriaceae bacterium]